MTTGKLIPFETKLQREDKRLSERKARDENARRKLLPLVVLVCETYRTSADDLLDAQNKHPTVVMARDIIRWLGYHRLHVGTSYLATALNQSRVAAAQTLPRVRKKLEGSEELRREMARIEALLDAQVKK